MVPVGEDQLPHMELTRKLVRRFNEMYAPVLKEPQHKLSSCSRLMGLDGNAKMGKSLGNAIYLADSPEEVVRKVKSAVTDTSRIKASDPGHPEVCVVNKYHQTFTPGEYENICEMCRKGAIGCVACKKILAESLNNLLDPCREKRAYYEAHRDEVRDIIKTGTEKACRIGEETVEKVREAMFLKV
jgi:tryptophanyl-tRNA synthetase